MRKGRVKGGIKSVLDTQKIEFAIELGKSAGSLGWRIRSFV